MPVLPSDNCQLSTLKLRRLGRQTYQPVWDAMRRFTDERDKQMADELWLVEHDPVFTQGLNGKAEHIHAPGGIPVIPVDRGGQVTYHGPGQLVAYLLMDLRRRHLGVRPVVTALEQAVIATLADYGIAGIARQDAPGVYVMGAKIASLGLRVRHGCSYHGLSLNADMDLEPFSRINPCGYEGLPVTQLKALGIEEDLEQVARRLIHHLARQLDFSEIEEAGADLPTEIASS